jgi:hypothetical protein
MTTQPEHPGAYKNPFVIDTSMWCTPNEIYEQVTKVIKDAAGIYLNKFDVPMLYALVADPVCLNWTYISDMADWRNVSPNIKIVINPTPVPTINTKWGFKTPILLVRPDNHTLPYVAWIEVSRR